MMYLFAHKTIICYVSLRCVVTLRYHAILLHCVIALRYYVALLRYVTSDPFTRPPTHPPTHPPTAITQPIHKINTQQQCHVQITRAIQISCVN